MLPFTVRCLTCNNFMYTGTKFNTPMERAGDYLGVPIYRFYYRCPQCSAQFTLCTDPENESYIAEQGATRPFGPSAGFKTQRAVAHESAAAMEEAQAKLDSGDNRTSGTSLGGANAMEAVEARAKGMRQQMESEEAVEALLERQRLAHSLGPDELLAMLRDGELGAALPDAAAPAEATDGVGPGSAAAASAVLAPVGRAEVAVDATADADDDDCGDSRDEAEVAFAERRLRDSAARLGIPAPAVSAAAEPLTDVGAMSEAGVTDAARAGVAVGIPDWGAAAPGIAASPAAAPGIAASQLSDTVAPTSSVGRFFAASARRRRDAVSKRARTADDEGVASEQLARPAHAAAGGVSGADGPSAKQVKPAEQVASVAAMMAYASSSSSGSDDDDGGE